MSAFVTTMKKFVGYSSQPGNTELTNERSTAVEIDNEKKPKIQRVPSILPVSEANKKSYDPLVVSIGPFHHEKELEIKEEYKWAMAHQYANNNEQLLHDLCNKVKAVAGDARNCYSEGSTKNIDEEKFTKMMFLDGCFILQFIHCCVKYDLKMKYCLAAFVKQDLLLLENQLPFLVLTELMSLRNDVEWKKTFSRFIAPFLALQDDKDDMEIKFDQCAHLLDMIQTMLINKAALTALTRERKKPSRYTFRSINELKTAGIHCKSSESHQWTDVQFESTLIKGSLKLPPLNIDDSTKSMLLNMIAYEACPDAPDDLGVTSYICFMDSLIDHVEDVKELRSKDILFNCLGSDQQVANLFNEVAENLVSNPFIYADVQKRLQNHYKSKKKTWLAEWLHTHFSSPWTVLAFIGAIFALVLSVIQTYESVYATEDSTPCPCSTVANSSS